MTKKKKNNNKKNYWEEACKRRRRRRTTRTTRTTTRTNNKKTTTTQWQQITRTEWTRRLRAEHVRCPWAFTPFKNGFICWTDLWTWSDYLWSHSISKCNYGSGFQKHFSISYLRMEDFWWISCECLLKENGPLIPIPPYVFYVIIKKIIKEKTCNNLPAKLWDLSSENQTRNAPTLKRSSNILWLPRG